MYKHTIIYDGEADMIPATVIGWGYNDGKILICDIKDYIPGQTENLYINYVSFSIITLFKINYICF